MNNEMMNNEMNVNAENRKENTMSIEARIMEAIKEQGGKDVVVTYREVTKNNGQVRKAYTVQECGSTLAPTIYIDQFDDIVGDEEEKNDRIVEYVVNVFRSECQRGGIEIDISEFMSREYVLDNVIPVLVNVERNLNFLTEAVHRVYTDDLAIIYKIPLKLSDDGEGTITILNKHMNIIGINSEDELYEHAVENVQGTGKIPEMGELLKALGHKDIPVSDLHIITNAKMTYGANVILDREVIKWLSELKNSEGVSNVYAIPSSIHEFIIVFKTVDDDDSMVDYISTMIKTINLTLDQEDVLSDNLFEFDGEMLHKVEI